MSMDMVGEVSDGLLPSSNSFACWLQFRLGCTGAHVSHYVAAAGGGQ